MKNRALRLFSLCCVGIAFALGANAAEMRLHPISLDAEKIQGDAAQAAKASATNIYIVQLTDNPIVAYEGGIAGYEATKPARGGKIDRDDARVKKYGDYLERQQDQMIHAAGGTKVHSYRYGINGFAARMTPAAAEQLRSRGDVVNVWKDEIRQLQTDTSPTYIGLTERGGAWASGLTGDDIVIGVVDTGIWPEHPSFADVKARIDLKRGRGHGYDDDDDDDDDGHRNRGRHHKDRGYGSIPEGFTPSGCDFGNTAANPMDAPASCSNKLVTARCYNSGFSAGPDANSPCGGDGAFLATYEFQSARDVDGHGSHTASTAGGNYGVEAQIGGEFLGEISGIAPHARIAAYKVCWDDDTNTGDGGCASSDSAAAIDQAVADGVDVINFSIGGSSTVFAGADDIAFLFAADAGVYVATSNGNAGPGAQTTGTPAGVPWLTAVGATQDDGVFGTALVVDSPNSAAGEYLALEGAGDVSLEDSGDITAELVPGVPLNGCVALTNAADVNGNIAFIQRGGCSFSTKYNMAAAAGAVAIVVFNSAGDPITMSAPGTTIPGEMISQADGEFVNAAAATGTIIATVGPSISVSLVNRIASFSSRGPNGGAPDVIKPDVSAPGVQILAAETPANGVGELFQSISGTSMASPHVAGAFALLKQAHPDWSPAQARSALMTTARQSLKKSFSDVAADPFDIGAGEILPNDALNPGLSYDVGFLDYLAFTCDNNVQLVSDGDCDFLAAVGFATDGSDLNLPSIGVAELVGSQTVTRTVTRVADYKKGKGHREHDDDDEDRHGDNSRVRFKVSVDAPPGIDVSVSPSTLRLKPGESATYEVTFTATDDAVMEQWAFGSLTWSDRKHSSKGWGHHDRKDGYEVRSPIAVKPKPFSAAAEVDSATGGATGGSVSIPIQFGYDGAYNAALEGLAEHIPLISNTVDNGANSQQAFCVTLPAVSHLRVSSFDADTTTPGQDDIDLRLFYNTSCSFAGAVQLGGSAGPTSEEVMDVAGAPAGVYIPVIDYFAAGVGNSIDYTVNFTLILGDDGNAIVSSAPTSASKGAMDVVTVDFGGLNAGSHYLGVLIHEDEFGEIGRTLVDVDTQ